MIFDYFDEAFYINLDKRPERKLSFEAGASELGLFIKRFPAITLDPSDPRLTSNLKKDPRCHYKIGCNLSHITIIKNAKELNLKRIMVFEDDCMFDKEFVTKMMKCVNELKLHSWDLMYMGGEPCEECLPFTENLRLVSEHGGIYGTHAYAINHTFYDRVINLNPFQPGSTDVLYMHQPNRIYVITKDLLATQSDVESDLWGGVIKRTELYKSTYLKYIK